MTRIGSYEILRELHRSRHTLVYAARRAGDAADAKGRFALKVFDAESVGLLESVAAGLTFVDGAIVQRKIADQGAKHWAPVLEVGDVDTPFYVTELFPLTAQRVVNRQAAVGERGLYTVVWSVVRGLTELRETFRRAHGNLKLSNVLIGGDESLQSPKTTRVVLSDPSAEAASARDRSADLLAIGELIHQLVLRRPFNRPTGVGQAAGAGRVGGDDDDDDGLLADLAALPPEWPVPASATWDRLGPHGERWLELCNWLLSPATADRPSDLVELAIALHRLTPRVQRFPVKWAVAAAVPLVLAAAGGGAFWALHTGVRGELVGVDQQWFGQLAKAVDDAPRRDRWSRADPSLKDLTAAVAAAKAQGVRFEVADDPVYSPLAYQNAKAALDVVQRVARDLTPAQWAGLANLNALRQKYEARCWVQPATFLAELARGTQPGPNVDVAAGVDRMLDVDVRVRADAGWLEESWTKYDADLQAAEKTGDRALVAFARRLRDSAALSLRVSDAGFDPAGTAVLRDHLPMAADLAKVAAAGFPNGVDRARLASDVDSRLNLADPGDDDIRKWLAGVDECRLVALDPAAEPLAGLSSGFRKLVDDVAKQPLDDAEQSTYQAERAKLQAKLASLSDGKYVRKDVARGQGDLMRVAADVQKDLGALRKQWVRVVDPETWVASLDQPLTTASDALKLRWKAYVDRQRADAAALGRDAEAFKRRKVQADAVREALTDLDKFPLKVTGFPEAFQSAVLAKRDAELSGLSRWSVPSADGEVSPPDREAAAKAVDERVRAFEAWCGLLWDLATEFPIGRELLTPADRPDRKWAERDAAFWADPIVQKLVEKDVARIAALAAVAGMSRPDLLSAARTSGAAEVAFAAYIRLGDTPAGGDPPTWPATPDELAADVSVRGNVDQRLRAIKNPAERTGPAEVLRQQGPVRWRRLADRAVLASTNDAPAGVERLLRSAVENQRAMAVTDADVDKLVPAARFNYAVFLARAAVEDAVANGGADPVLRARADAVARAAAAVGDRPEVRALAARLARLTTDEPMSADVRLRAPQPPDTLAVPIQKDASLTFVRVAPPGRRPFYLSATELSLGQFIDLVNARGNWSVANALLGNVADPSAGASSPAATRGPRAWARPGVADAAIDRYANTVWEYESADGRPREFQFAEPLRVNQFNKRSLRPEAGGNVQFDHPMQQLPAQAALYAAGLANCRLPTAVEWQAAYKMDQAAVTAAPTAAADGNPLPPTVPPNLRDKTFAAQVAFARKQSLADQWPDGGASGVFRPKDAKPPVDVGLVRDVDDKTLLFRPVTAGGGGPFANLIGNVAELVCDEADAFDALPDRASPAALRQYAKAYGGQVAVVGGSAFSDPALELTKPYSLPSTAAPYADVGVRLAFTAPARTTAERLKWYLDEQGYLTAANPGATKNAE